MDVLLLIVRLVLAGVFGFAAMAKVTDMAATRRALGEFGVPSSLTMPAAYLLPLVELAIALALLFTTASWFGAVGAVVLLIVFIAAMAFQLSRGNAPDCNCFGQVHSSPVSYVGIVRNVVLVALATVLLSQGRDTQGVAIVRSEQDIPSFIFGVVVIGLLAAIFLEMSRLSARQAEVADRLDAVEFASIEGAAVGRENVSHPHEGLPIGAMFPDFLLPSLDNRVVSRSDLIDSGGPVLFIFVSPSCTPCKGLVPEFDAWRDELAGKVRLVLVSGGKPEENLEKFGSGDKASVLLQTSRELADKAKARWTPTALLMGADGRVASHAAAGDDAIRSLVGQIREADMSDKMAYFANFSSHSHDLRIGETVPPFSLEDLKGNKTDSSVFAGKSTLVAFWSLTCGYCQQMVEELREWERLKGPDDPALILLSDGDRAANEELRLSSPILIDDGHAVSEQFGMYGTPSAVLVDADGRIVSETAVGASDIWALVGKKNMDVINIEV